MTDIDGAYEIIERLRVERNEARAEVERLRAELAAVPWSALRFCVDIAHFTYDVEQDTAAKWLEANAPQDGAE